MSYETLFKEQLELKEKLSLENIPEGEIIKFGGLNLHEGNNLSWYPDNKLFLAHSCVHTIFSKKNKFASEIRVKEIHRRIEQEMTRRGIKHELFDKLDTY